MFFRLTQRLLKIAVSGLTGTAFDLETSNFSQGQGNQGFERRRSPLRRTIKSAD
jgi:hypothetical protein